MRCVFWSSQAQGKARAIDQNTRRVPIDFAPLAYRKSRFNMAARAGLL